MRTTRLELIAATAAHCQADLFDRAGLARLLAAAIAPGEWPPEALDVEALTWCRDYLTDHPEAAGWTMWYVVATTGRRLAIGVVGLKGPPNADGFVEVGYALVPSHQGRGLGTEAVGALLAWAFAHPQVVGVAAHTYADLAGSLGLLRKLGFREVGPGDEPGTTRFLLRRDDINKVV